MKQSELDELTRKADAYDQQQGREGGNLTNESDIGEMKAEIRHLRDELAKSGTEKKRACSHHGSEQECALAGQQETALRVQVEALVARVAQLEAKTTEPPTTCANCDAELDVSGIEPGTTVTCGNCKASIKLEE